MLSKRLSIIAAVGFVIMWSSGFVGARLGTAEASSMTILMWRFIVASGILAIWWLWKQRKKLSVKSVATQALIGLFAQSGYLYCVFLSVENGVSAGTSNLITTLQPIVAAALAGPILNESTSKKQWGGLVLGILGVLFVVYGDLGSSTSVPLWAYALSFMAMISLVFATLYEKTLKSSISITDALPIQTLISALFFTIIAVNTGQATPPATTSFWIAVAWVAGLSTIGGYGFYWLNLKLGSITRVSSLLYLTPPVTMVWSYVMFGDRIGFLTIVGMVVCSLGVWVISRDRSSNLKKREFKKEVV
ncbi:DMT family transporter [Alkalihalobacillus sp. CinArs1]|uniref:DMT family transporter n=1 Tax=Alkalihalobacillus sp. CinArs1 TaxID=2995314 RepID=UPI0022DD5E4F|nr:DMT family transporter [Alkalihalobacillus sp. CinArs1]